MSDLFRSAINYFNQTSPVPVPLGNVDHPLVGTMVDVGAVKLKIRSLIAEGGYALVFTAQDSHGDWFALKRQLAVDREAANAVINEIRFLRDLSGHPAIIRYAQATQNKQGVDSQNGRVEFLILTELCSGGSVVEVLNRRSFSVAEVLKVFYAACSAVCHMHSQLPPITHRDIKIENLLFDDSGRTKLCDFGSATTEVFMPDDSWSAQQRSCLEEELARHTTPMYRTPEILDLYSHFPIGPAQDVWALGCILFYLCYRKHPFADSAKLRILNAKYALPVVETEYNVFHPIIESILQIDPRNRMKIADLCGKLRDLATAISADLFAPVENLQAPQPLDDSTQFPSKTVGANQLHDEISNLGEMAKNFVSLRSTALHSKTNSEFVQQQGAAMLDALKDQGMSWFKAIKEKTTTVAQSVQLAYVNREADITLLTSRLLIAPQIQGVSETLNMQAEEVMRRGICERIKSRFAMYNLSTRSLKCGYTNSVVERPLPPVESGLTPTIESLLSICLDIISVLQQNKADAIVLTGSIEHCVLISVSLLLYVHLISNPNLAVEFVHSKRQNFTIPPSYHRQIQLLYKVTASNVEDLSSLVHNRLVVLHSLLIAPIPLFNRTRTGCRPVVDVYADGRKIASSFTTYDKLRSYDIANDELIDLDLENASVTADIQINVYHARWMKIHSHMQLSTMFSLTFHANFIDPCAHILEYNLADLDIRTDDRQKFGRSFKVGVQLQIDDRDHRFNVLDKQAFLSGTWSNFSSNVLVSDYTEYDLLVQSVSGSEIPAVSLEQESDIVANLMSSSGSERRSPDNFFFTLDWQSSADHSNTIESSASNATSVHGADNYCSDPHLKIDHDLWRERDCSVRVSPADELDQLKYESEAVGDITIDDMLVNLNSEDDHMNAHTEFRAGTDLLGLKTDIHLLPSQLHSGVSLTVADNVGNSSIPFNTNDDYIISMNAVRDWKGVDENVADLQRIISAPNLSNDTPASSESTFDPFKDFLSSHRVDCKAMSTGVKGIKSKGKLDADTFGDLLSSHGFTSTTSSASRSIGAMRRENEIKDMDPIRDWTRGKEKNIRALLSSLDEVLWPENLNWKQPTMSDLLTAVQVKKTYRKACLVVHPDKQVGTENEPLARAIFAELNEAWSTFEANPS